MKDWQEEWKETLQEEIQREIDLLYSHEIGSLLYAFNNFSYDKFISYFQYILRKAHHRRFTYSQESNPIYYGEFQIETAS
tara:strand:- start:404 stop:643 length:240 start_codon:yes stop_codon:yes gene_type:complete